MPIDADAIGISYKIDLTKLSASIQNAKKMLAGFHNELASLAQKASVKITVNDQSVSAAKAKIEKFTNAIQATLDKTGKLKIETVSKGFGSIATGDVDKASIALKALHKEMGGTRDVIPELNARFRAAETAIAKTGAAMNVAGEKGNVFMKKMDASTIALAHYRDQIKYTKDGIVSTATAEEEAAIVKEKVTKKRTAATQKLKDETKATKDAIKAKKELSAAAQSTTNQLARMGITTNTTTSDLKRMNLNSLETSKALKLTKDRIAELEKATTRSGKATAGASEEHRKLQQRLPYLQDEANKGVKAFGDYRRAMDRWGQGFKYMMLSQAAWIASGAILFGTLSAVGGAIKSFIDFHQDMRDAAAIVQATTTGYEKMEKAAVKAFLNSTMSLKDTTQALKILGQTGMEAAEAAVVLETVYKITTATGGDTATVVKFLTTALKVWKLEANEAAAVGNVLGAALNYSKLDVEDLGTAFNYVASMAKSVGLSITDLSAIMAVMSNAGVKASTMATGLRGVFAKLLGPTPKLRKELEKVGLTMQDVSLISNDFFTVLKNLEKAGFDVESVFKGFQRREGAGLLVLLEQGSEKLDLMRRALKDTTAVEVMFERSMKGMKNQITLAGHAIQQYMIDRLDFLRPALTGTAKFIRELFTTLGDLNKVIMLTLGSWIIYQSTLIGISIATSATTTATVRLVGALSLLSRHPVFLAMAGLVLAHTIYKRVVDETTESLDEQIKRHNKTTDDLRKLQIAMSMTNKTDQEKLALLREYAKDYPQLLGYLESHRDNIMGVDDALKGFIAASEKAKRATKFLTLAQINADIAITESLKRTREEQAKQSDGYFDKIVAYFAKGPLKEYENALDKLRQKKKLLRLDLGLRSEDTWDEDFPETGDKGKDTIVVWTDKMQKALEKLRLKVGTERDKAKKILEDGLEDFELIEGMKEEVLAKTLEARRLLYQKYNETINKINEKEEKAKKVIFDGLSNKVKKEEAVIAKFDAQQSARIEKNRAMHEKELERSTDSQRKWVTKISKFNEDLTEDNIKLIKDEYTKRQFYLEKEILERRRKYQELLAEAEDYFTDLAKLAIDNPFLIPELDRVAKLIENIKSMQGVLSGIEGKERGALAKEAPWNFSAGMEEGLREARTEISNEYEIWRNASKNTALAMRDSFSDLFFDAMKGELKSLGDYWKAFGNAVKREIANMAAAWVTSGLLKLGGDLLLKGFIGATNIGGGLGGTALAEHDGGLIRKMHGGGPALKSDETLRVLKENEFVIKDSSTRSLGLNALNFMNKTGRMPSAGPNVTSVHNSYTIVAMDSESMDQALRRGGARAIQDISIGSYIYESERRNRPAFGMGR